jgi:septal ring factor EnvC (AmiA/AmiB activator)
MNQAVAPRRALAAAIGLALPLGLAAAALAESSLSPILLAQANRPAMRGAVDIDSLKQRDEEFEAVQAERQKAVQAEARLREEIDAIAADRHQLNQQLIDTAARVRAVEIRIAATEARLKPLDDNDRAIRKSLDGRHAVIAEVLAALQRIGRRPLPAVMVKPEDALQSVRTAIMLGAVLPEMRQAAENLAADLAELVRLRKEITAERDALARDVAVQSEDRDRLSLLIEGRQKKQAATEMEFEAERQRAAALARQVDNLKDLIAKLEQGLDSASRAARGAARTALEQPALGNMNDPGRLGPAISFASAQGLLPLPVNGVKIRDFGGPDSTGAVEKGLSIATRAGAQVTAPCDGRIVYAGTFRSYGQLLILNAGGGYHVLLMGMDRLSVDPGQFVLTGEPVGVMGGGAQVAAAGAVIGSRQPVLYVEFRKDGTPIDPSPWWATSESEKVRG